MWTIRHIGNAIEENIPRVDPSQWNEYFPTMEVVLGLKECQKCLNSMNFTWGKFAPFIIEIVEKEQTNKKIYWNEN